MTSEATRTSALLDNAKSALEMYHEVQADDDGALTFHHAGVPCAVQAVELAEGLLVLSMNCVIAWDLPDSNELAVTAAQRASEGLFGTLGITHTDAGMDLTLRYTFPADGLSSTALGTLLMLVVSNASQLRAELVSN